MSNTIDNVGGKPTVQGPPVAPAVTQKTSDTSAPTIQLTDRAVYVRILKPASDIARPVLVRLGVFSDNESSLNKEIELAQKVKNITYPDSPLKEGVKKKAVDNLKLKLAELNVSDKDAIDIVKTYMETGELPEQESYPGIKVENLQAAVDAKPTMRQLLAELVTKGVLGPKTAAVLDTTYRLAAKLLAAGVVLATISATLAAAGITLPVSAAIIVVAITAIAVTTIVLTEGVENYEAAKTVKVSNAEDTKKAAEEAEKADLIDETAALLASERLKAFFKEAATTLGKVQDIAADIKKEGSTGDKLYEVITEEILTPFKTVSAAAKKM